MDKKKFLLTKVKEIIKHFEGKKEYPLIVLGGSLGSFFGMVHDKSDIDLIVFTSIEGELPSKALMSIPGFKEIHIVRRQYIKVDVLENLEEAYRLDISYRQISKEAIKNLLVLDDQTILEDLDSYISYFVETSVLRDDFAIYHPFQERLKKVFRTNHYELLEKVIFSLYRKLKKMKEDWEIASIGGVVDFDYYNNNRQQYIATLIYIYTLACGQIISEKSVFARRRSKLEDYIGIDRNLLRQTIPRDENEMYLAKKALADLARWIHSKSSYHLPDFPWDKYQKLFLVD